jgi:hypothetical protein
MASLQLEISRDLNEWSNFISNSPQSNPFLSANWLKTYFEIFNLNFEVLFVKKCHEIVAGVILPVKKKLLFFVSTPLPFTYYSGIIFKNFKPKKDRRKSLKKTSQF